MKNKYISKIYLFALLFLLNITKIESFQNFKAFSDPKDSNSYYIITSNNISYYNNFIFETKINLPDSLIITTESEFALISLDYFKNAENIPDLLIIKNYIYAVSAGNVICYSKFNELDSSVYSCEVNVYKCFDLHCYFIIGCIDSNKQLTLSLYENPQEYCLYDNPIYALTKKIINDINSENFSCQLIESIQYNDYILICFYRSINSNEILATGFNIDVNNKNISEIYTLKSSRLIGNPMYIKSIISQNKNVSYVCYFNDNDENDCNCLTYNIRSNEFSNEKKTYLRNCLKNIFSLNLEFYNNINQSFLYCFQSSSKIDFMNINENCTLYNEEIYDLNSKIINCSEYYFSTISHNIYNISIFLNCNNTLSINNIGELKEFILPSAISTTQIIISTLPITIISTLPTTIPDSIISSNSIYSYTDIITNTDIDTTPYIIQKKINMTKEEVIDNLKEIIKEYQIGKIYELFGNDYDAKISPLNVKDYKNLSTYIEFSICEDILRKYYNLSSNEILSIFQIEIYKL